MIYKIVLIMLIPLPLFLMVVLSKHINIVKSSKDIGRYMGLSKIWTLVIGMVFFYGIGFLFYRSNLLSILVSMLGFLIPGMVRSHLKKKRIREYKIQFREALYNLSSAMQAGVSLQNSFSEAINGLELVFGSNAHIVREFKIIVNKLRINYTIEECLVDFNKVFGLEEVDTFIELLRICRRKGGNIVELIKGCDILISEKIRIEEEILTVLSEKKFEQGVLLAVPFILMIVLSLTSREFIAPLFSTVYGRIASTISLMLISISILVTKKIMDIEV